MATLADEVELDSLSRERLEREPDRTTTRKLEMLRSYAETADEAGKAKRLILRFLQSPVEILGDDERVTAIRLVRNELYAADDGSIRSRPTERQELVETGLVFRSVGYRGVPLDGLPFHERWGVIPNEEGRVLDDGAPRPGVYVSGWIKRGPSGVIGTNKPDAGETVRAMLADLSSGRTLDPRHPRPEALSRLLEARSVRVISYEDWQAIDAAEIERGRQQGRPRIKLIERDEFLEALLPR